MKKLLLFITLLLLFTSCESESSRRNTIKQYRVTYIGYKSGRTLKCVTNIDARNPIEVGTIIKENTFTSFNSVSINTIRLIK